MVVINYILKQNFEEESSSKALNKTFVKIEKKIEIYLIESRYEVLL